ncbi:MAG TPA: AAA family ATPase [Candidatus Eremiobacteraceae bacterium]|nr:AAA family ATPase [Candidatus Eremiobacteraceae bacterium]
MIGRSIRCRTFVGRRKELAELDDARKWLSKSSGSFVLVTGEAGIGKTRLLNEFLGLAHARRARNVVNTECLQRAQQPLGPVRALVRALVQLVALADMPPPVLRALVQVMPEELPRDLVDEHARFALEKDQLFASLLAFLKLICAKRATLLTIEDIHWSDESTIDFLSYLVNRMESMRLLVVATCRADELERDERLLASMSQMFRARCIRRVILDPLPSAEIRAVVDGTLDGRGTLPEPIIRDIEQRSEGNPFFAEELVKHYVERGSPIRPASNLPLSIRASIAQRLVVLTPDERAIISCAAVLGQRFDPALLAIVVDREPGAIVPTLRKAQDLDLITDDGQRRLSVRFRHALTRQTIYDSVPAFEARSLHLKILVTLEADHDSDTYVEERAYHAWAAGDAAKTVRYNERAGEAAFSLRALPEALTCFQRALASSSNPDDEARILGRIGAIERVQGHSQAARDVLEAALAIRLERKEVDAAASLVASIAGQRYNVGDHGALAYAESFLAECGPSIGSQARDNLIVVAARIACALCDFHAAERLLEAMSDPEALAPGARQNYLIVQLMRHSHSGEATEWKRSAAQVDSLLPQLAPESVVAVEAALAMTGIYLGVNEHVEMALDRAERVERDWGFRGQRLYALATKAEYLFQRGRIDEARMCVDEVARNQDFRPARRVGALVAARISAASGDAALWNRFDAEVLREARDKLEDPDCVYILGSYAALRAATGDLDAARADLRAAIASVAIAAPEAMYIMLDAVRLLDLDQLTPVRRLIEKRVDSTLPTLSANAKLGAAIIAARQGRTDEAVSLASDAAALYAGLGWPMLEARALEVCGQTEAARAIYLSHGATADARRLADSAAPMNEAVADALSSREREVAELVARGLRNSEIAKRLSIGNKTVEKHLASVFGKLGVRSRSEVVAHMAASRDRAAN